MPIVLPIAASEAAPSGECNWTWLDIARRVRKECGLSGTDESPSSVVDQTGEMLHIVNWVESAWKAIQAHKLWDWAWEIVEITIPSGEYLVDENVSAHRYVKDSAMLDESNMQYLPWAQFRSSFPSARITAGTPTFWTVRPDRSFAVSALVEADTTITVERYSDAGCIGGDEDTPEMPQHLREAIVWRAVMFYAGHDEAGALYTHAKAEFRRILGEAALDQTPEIELGEPLA